MKILIVSRGWPTDKDPKWGCFEKDQAEALQSLGHEIKVLCLDCRFSFKPHIPKISRTRINGIEYVSFKGFPQAIIALIAGNKKAIEYEQWMLSKIYEELLIEGYKTDVVYSHFVLNSAAASVLKKKYGLPLVVIEHSSELVKDKITSIINDQAKIAYSVANHVIAVSDYLKHRIKERFDINCEVVPNMLGTEFLKEPSITDKQLTEGLKILSVGALLPLKGFAELITALSKSNIPNDWELVIIGYGKLENNLRELARSLGLERNVKFLGAKNKSEIILEMSTSDFFILNTKRETFGVVYIEALSQGLPCIATECGGAEGIIDESNGLNVEVGNEDALVKAIEYMVVHYKDYNRNNIRTECLKKYAPREVAKKIEQILEKNIQK